MRGRVEGWGWEGVGGGRGGEGKRGGGLMILGEYEGWWGRRGREREKGRVGRLTGGFVG